MSDSRRLYFIPLLDDALGSPNPKSALVAALKKIRQLGMTKDYQEGFSQFKAFLRNIIEAHVLTAPERKQSFSDEIYGLISDLVTDSFEGSDEEKIVLIEAFANDEKWQPEYDRIKSNLEEFLFPQPTLTIEVLKDNRVIASLSPSELPTKLMDIDPGRYIVRLSNGRVLWENQLLRKQLLWLEAFTDEDLPMAAKTEDMTKATVTESLLNGELTLDVIPGLKKGVLRFGHGKRRE